MRQAGLFGLSEHLKRLSAHGDPLEELGRIIDFEAFRPVLVAALAYGDGAKGGRPRGPLPPILRSFRGDSWTTSNLPYILAAVSRLRSGGKWTRIVRAQSLLYQGKRQ